MKLTPAGILLCGLALYTVLAIVTLIVLVAVP